MARPTSKALIQNTIEAFMAAGLPVGRVEVTKDGIVVHPATTDSAGDRPCDEREAIERAFD